MAVLRAGSIFARDFKVVGPLRAGGMGAVYVVEQLSTGKQRALKVLAPELAFDPVTRDRLALEARVGAQIDSDHVVEVVTAGVDDETELPYLVMELLKGEDLADALKRRGPFSLEEVGEILAQVGHALERAHAQGIVHRDLKPENLYLAHSRRPDEPFLVKILDFGVAKLVDQSARPSTQTVGTPHFMAPEQTDRAGRITAAADVWPLGLIAFVLLTKHDFWRSAGKGSVPVLMREVLFEPIPPASERALEYGQAGCLTAGFDDWFARCVARDVEGRYPDGVTAVRAYHELVLGRPSSPRGSRPSVQGPRGSAPKAAETEPPPRGETLDIWLGDDLVVPPASRGTPQAEPPASPVPLELDLPAGRRAGGRHDPARAARRPVGAREHRSPARTILAATTGALVVLGLAWGAIFYWTKRPDAAPGAPLPSGAAPDDRAVERSTPSVACEASRARLASAGASGAIEPAGWVVELWLARPKGELDGDAALQALLRPASVTAALGATGDGAVDVEPGSAPREAGRAPGWPSATVRFRGAHAAAYFAPESRARFVVFADRLAAATGATLGALYARCAHLRHHDMGAWFRGADAPGAAVALLYGVGAFSEPPTVLRDGAKRSGPSELDALRRAASRVDEQTLGATVGAEGGSLARDPETRAFVIRFPPGSTRASAAAKALAARLPPP